MICRYSKIFLLLFCRRIEWLILRVRVCNLSWLDDSHHFSRAWLWTATRLLQNVEIGLAVIIGALLGIDALVMWRFSWFMFCYLMSSLSWKHARLACLHLVCNWWILITAWKIWISIVEFLVTWVASMRSINQFVPLWSVIGVILVENMILRRLIRLSAWVSYVLRHCILLINNQRSTNT